MSGEPLPARILIPVANPVTAEELIRIGASLLEPRTGELTALGIVEVPEGMPLSEGATRARQARRLLQKVLDYAPEGTTIHPLVRIGRHASAGIVEAAAEQEADLMIFGWGGKSGPHREGGAPVISPTIDEVVRESPCDIAVVKQRGAREIRRILVPVRGGPHAELALRFADALAHRHDATVVVMHLVPSGVTEAVRAQAEHALAAFARQHVTARSEPILRETRNVRTAILREADHADLVVMGASAPPGEPGTSLFGALPGGHRPAGQADGHRRQDARSDRAPDVRAAGPARRVAGRGRPRGRGVAGRPRPRGSLVRRGQLPPRRVRGPGPADRPQAEAGRHGQPRAADPQRSRDDRADRPPGHPRDAGALPAAGRDPGDRLRVHGRHPAHRRGRGRPRGPARRRPAPLRLVPGQGRGAVEVPLRDDRATSWSGRTRTSATGTTGWCTGRSGRCSWSRDSST